MDLLSGFCTAGAGRRRIRTLPCSTASLSCPTKSGHGAEKTFEFPVLPQALATFDMPILLTGDHAKVTRRLYILADSREPTSFRHFAQKVEGQPGWRVAKQPSSHDVMVDMPKELVAELLTLV